MSLPDELYNLKFAENFDVVCTLYAGDERFKDICDEYCKSIIKAENYKKKYEKNFKHQLEFENLSKELEEEILFYIIRNM